MKVFKYHFIEKESDVTIISESIKAIKRAKKTFFYHRKCLEDFIKENEVFLTSFSPIEVQSNHEIINLMTEAAFSCDVGPMATVAGALADLMLKIMKQPENSGDEPARIALVENGGEIAIDSEQEMKIALYAGENRLNLNIGFIIQKKDCPIGIATSSATIGHAISLGQADAVTIFADNATLADGYATRIANLVKGDDIDLSIRNALNEVQNYPAIRGALISRNDKVGYVGKLPRIIKIEGDQRKILDRKLKELNTI